MISDNGSYILSNGIVVLVDSDIESYLNNTLVFKKSLPKKVIYNKDSVNQIIKQEVEEKMPEIERAFIVTEDVHEVEGVRIKKTH